MRQTETRMAVSVDPTLVLVCRPRPDDAPLATRRELVGALRGELPEALLVVAWPEVARQVAGTPEAEGQQALEL